MLLAPPAILMGGTLPAVTAALKRPDGRSVVFSLHVHAALFIFGLPFLFLPYQLVYIFVAAAMAYLYLALLRVYGEGHFSTILRLPVLLFFFGVVWLIGATMVTALLVRTS